MLPLQSPYFPPSSAGLQINVRFQNGIEELCFRNPFHEQVHSFLFEASTSNKVVSSITSSDGELICHLIDSEQEVSLAILEESQWVRSQPFSPAQFRLCTSWEAPTQVGQLQVTDGQDLSPCWLPLEPAADPFFDVNASSGKRQLETCSDGASIQPPAQHAIAVINKDLTSHYFCLLPFQVEGAAAGDPDSCQTVEHSIPFDLDSKYSNLFNNVPDLKSFEDGRACWGATSSLVEDIDDSFEVTGTAGSLQLAQQVTVKTVSGLTCSPTVSRDAGLEVVEVYDRVDAPDPVSFNLFDEFTFSADSSEHEFCKMSLLLSSPSSAPASWNGATDRSYLIDTPANLNSVKQSSAAQFSFDKTTPFHVDRYFRVENLLRRSSAVVHLSLTVCGGESVQVEGLPLILDQVYKTGKVKKVSYAGWFTVDTSDTSSACGEYTLELYKNPEGTQTYNSNGRVVISEAKKELEIDRGRLAYFNTFYLGVVTKGKVIGTKPIHLTVSKNNQCSLTFLLPRKISSPKVSRISMEFCVPPFEVDLGPGDYARCKDSDAYTLSTSASKEGVPPTFVNYLGVVKDDEVCFTLIGEPDPTKKLYMYGRVADGKFTFPERSDAFKVSMCGAETISGPTLIEKAFPPTANAMALATLNEDLYTSSDSACPRAGFYYSDSLPFTETKAEAGMTSLTAPTDTPTKLTRYFKAYTEGLAKSELITMTLVVCGLEEPSLLEPEVLSITESFNSEEAAPFKTVAQSDYKKWFSVDYSHPSSSMSCEGAGPELFADATGTQSWTDTDLVKINAKTGDLEFFRSVAAVNKKAYLVLKTKGGRTAAREMDITVESLCGDEAISATKFKDEIIIEPTKDSTVEIDLEEHFQFQSSSADCPVSRFKVYPVGSRLLPPIRDSLGSISHSMQPVKKSYIIMAGSNDVWASFEFKVVICGNENVAVLSKGAFSKMYAPEGGQSQMGVDDFFSIDTSGTDTAPACGELITSLLFTDASLSSPFVPPSSSLQFSDGELITSLDQGLQPQTFVWAIETRGKQKASLEISIGVCGFESIITNVIKDEEAFTIGTKGALQQVMLGEYVEFTSGEGECPVQTVTLSKYDASGSLQEIASDDPSASFKEGIEIGQPGKHVFELKAVTRGKVEAKAEVTLVVCGKETVSATEAEPYDIEMMLGAPSELITNSVLQSWFEVTAKGAHPAYLGCPIKSFIICANRECEALARPDGISISPLPTFAATGGDAPTSPGGLPHYHLFLLNYPNLDSAQATVTGLSIGRSSFFIGAVSSGYQVGTKRVRVNVICGLEVLSLRKEAAIRTKVVGARRPFTITRSVYKNFFKTSVEDCPVREFEATFVAIRREDDNRYISSRTWNLTIDESKQIRKASRAIILTQAKGNLIITTADLDLKGVYFFSLEATSKGGVKITKSIKVNMTSLNEEEAGASNFAPDFSRPLRPFIFNMSEEDPQLVYTSPKIEDAEGNEVEATIEVSPADRRFLQASQKGSKIVLRFIKKNLQPSDVGDHSVKIIIRDDVSRQASRHQWHFKIVKKPDLSSQVEEVRPEASVQKKEPAPLLRGEQQDAQEIRVRETTNGWKPKASRETVEKSIAQWKSSIGELKPGLEQKNPEPTKDGKVKLEFEQQLAVPSFVLAEAKRRRLATATPGEPGEMTFIPLSQLDVTRDLFDISLLMKSGQSSEFSLEIEEWTDSGIEINFNFSNPLVISTGTEPDELEIAIKDPSLFVSEGSNQIPSSAPMRISLPKQLPLDLYQAGDEAKLIQATLLTALLLIFGVMLYLGANYHPLWAFFMVMQAASVFGKLSVPAFAEEFFEAASGMSLDLPSVLGPWAFFTVVALIVLGVKAASSPGKTGLFSSHHPQHQSSEILPRAVALTALVLILPASSLMMDIMPLPIAILISFGLVVGQGFAIANQLQIEKYRRQAGFEVNCLKSLYPFMKQSKGTYLWASGLTSAKVMTFAVIIDFNKHVIALQVVLILLMLSSALIGHQYPFERYEFNRVEIANCFLLMMVAMAVLALDYVGSEFIMSGKLVVGALAILIIFNLANVLRAASLRLSAAWNQRKKQQAYERMFINYSSLMLAKRSFVLEQLPHQTKNSSESDDSSGSYSLRSDTSGSDKKDAAGVIYGHTIGELQTPRLPVYQQAIPISISPATIGVHQMILNLEEEGASSADPLVKTPQTQIDTAQTQIEVQNPQFTPESTTPTPQEDPAAPKRKEPKKPSAKHLSKLSASGQLTSELPLEKVDEEELEAGHSMMVDDQHLGTITERTEPFQFRGPDLPRVEQQLPQAAKSISDDGEEVDILSLPSELIEKLDMDLGDPTQATDLMKDVMDLYENEEEREKREALERAVSELTKALKKMEVDFDLGKKKLEEVKADLEGVITRDDLDAFREKKEKEQKERQRNEVSSRSSESNEDESEESSSEETGSEETGSSEETSGSEESSSEAEDQHSSQVQTLNRRMSLRQVSLAQKMKATKKEMFPCREDLAKREAQMYIEVAKAKLKELQENRVQPFKSISSSAADGSKDAKVEVGDVASHEQDDQIKKGEEEIKESSSNRTSDKVLPLTDETTFQFELDQILVETQDMREPQEVSRSVSSAKQDEESDKIEGQDAPCICSINCTGPCEQYQEILEEVRRTQVSSSGSQPVENTPGGE